MLERFLESESIGDKFKVILGYIIRSALTKETENSGTPLTGTDRSEASKRADIFLK